MIPTRLVLLSAASAATLLCATPRLEAASISISTLTSNSSTVTATAITTNGNNSSGGGGIQSVNVTNAGTSALLVPGAMVTAATQYIGNIAADRDMVGKATASGVISVNYTDTFTITPDIAATTYTVAIDTSILGALTGNDDGAGASSTGAASITNVTGALNGSPNSNLGLSVAASAANPTSGTSSTNISGANTLSLGPFTGTQVLQLNFTWTMSTSSSGANALVSAPEEAVRLGAPGQLSFSSADDYPGVGSRTQANDGHFVSITATVVSVPEPSTLILAALGGLALLRMRRRNLWS